MIAPSAEDKPVHDIPCEEAESTEDEVIDSLLQDSVEVYGSTLEEDEDELKQDTAIESLESERLLLMEDEENPVDDIVKENEVAQLPEVKAEVSKHTLARYMTCMFGWIWKIKATSSFIYLCWFVPRIFSPCLSYRS